MRKGTLVVAGLIFLVALSFWLRERKNLRERAQIEQWASRGGYSVVDVDPQPFEVSPFTWTSSKNQDIYLVTVKDGNGKRRKVWVRCGGYVLGPLADQVDVRWEDEQRL
jgi:hypothetical protein